MKPQEYIEAIADAPDSSQHIQKMMAVRIAAQVHCLNDEYYFGKIIMKK